VLSGELELLGLCGALPALLGHLLRARARARVRARARARVRVRVRVNPDSQPYP